MRRFIIIGLFSLFSLWFITLSIRRAVRSEAEATVQQMRDATGRVLSDNVESTGRVLSDNVETTVQEGSDLVGGLFQLGQKAAREIDRSVHEVVKMDAAERSKMGQRVHAAIANHQTLASDPQVTDKLRRLASPFLRRQVADSGPVQFFIVESPEINAFAHVGGYIYVHRGLLEFVENDDELAFVLGHEVAHLRLGHCARNSAISFRSEQVAGELGSTVAQMAYQSIAVGYSEEMELEADAWAF
ncbi:MAG: M48 family metalloprotease [Planctomycetota bacterium]